MEILLGVLIALGWILGVILSRIITTFIHELGHAIPSLMFTEGDVQIHIGSYGDDKNSSQFSLGRLKTFFKFDVFNWNIGLCQHQGAKTVAQTLLIILGGPVFSLLIGIVLLFLIFNYTWSNGIIFIFSFFILASIYDFFVNILPIDYPIQMADGTVTYNDGTMLTKVLRESNLPESYFEGLKLREEKKYAEAAVLFKNLLDEGINKKDLHHNYVACLVKMKEYDQALEYLNSSIGKNKIKLKDYPLLGEIYFLKGDYTKTIGIYNKYLYKHFEDVEVLLQRGIVFTQLSEYQKAMNDFSSVIARQPQSPQALNQRALTKIRLGELTSAWTDLEASKKLDDSNPNLFLHYGYYFREKNDRAKAIEHFQKAKEMKVDFHGIDYLIETT